MAVIFCGTFCSCLHKTRLFTGAMLATPPAFIATPMLVYAALRFGTGIGGPLLIIFVGSFAPCVISAYRGARLVADRPRLNGSACR